MTKRQVLVYLAGAYSGDIDKNIDIARYYSIKLWQEGYTVICPHLNTANFEKDCSCGYEDYMEAYFNILKRCDMIYMLPNWKQSSGAVRELELAMKSNIPVVFL